MTTSFLAEPLAWPFPAEGVHRGIPLGNGVFGVLVWGDGAPLRLTINRADYWDHHGGHRFSEDATYANLRACLARGDEAELRRVFEGRTGAKERPVRPTRLPMGRIDLAAGPDARVTRGALDLHTGEATLEMARGSSALRFRCMVPRGLPALCGVLEGTGAADVTPQGRPVDAAEVWRHLHGLGYPDPVRFGDGREGGWVQERPDEPALAVMWRTAARSSTRVEVFGCAAYGETASAAQDEARGLLARLAERGYEGVAEETASWWRQYWQTACRVQIPGPDLELLYYLGMYKLAGLSMPGTPAATLQGPWVEEHQLPPWAADYHFNINVQECYWPAFGGNHPEALLPLAEMLKSWTPTLRENARIFTGRDDGLMLPHAVDDRCTCMGGFWTGSLDHGSTAWVGQLLWLYYRHTMDKAFLADTAYPFLKGAMRVYEAMLDECDDALCLPVGVSPEYGGAGFSACGRNASFQLAAIHWLCRALVEASAVLDRDREDRTAWRAVDRRLPLAALVPLGNGHEIAVWENEPLAESHRHHSHLAGIYPFDIFDYHGTRADRELVESSLRRWVQNGMGLWSGWSMPWASILFTRTARPDMAGETLHLYRRAFMNQGYASLHDACFAGFTLMYGREDLMQIEAALAASAAVLEMLGHTAQGTVRLFEGVPSDRPDAAFENLRVEGAFLISAERTQGRVDEVRVRAEAGGALRLANPWGGQQKVRVVREGREEALASAAVLELDLARDEEVRFLPV